MTERILAIIRIGGRLEAGQAPRLIAAINGAHLYAAEGDTWFQPRDAADLVAARTATGFLELTDDEAPYGEMPGIVVICRELGLSYRLWHEGSNDCGAEISIWVPGMERAVTFSGDHTNPDAILVDTNHISGALSAFRLGLVESAVESLEAMLPEVPELPAFEVVGMNPDVSVAKCCADSLGVSH